MTRQEKQLLLEEEYDELYAYIWQYVAVRVFSASNREDVVSIIFIQALEIIDSYNPRKGTLRQWLTGIARYKVLNYFRNNHVFTDIENIETAILKPVASLEQALQNKIDVQIVLDNLSDDQRSLIYLHYIDGLTLTEIADLFNTSPTTMRKRFSRLVAKLRKIHK